MIAKNTSSMSRNLKSYRCLNTYHKNLRGEPWKMSERGHGIVLKILEVMLKFILCSLYAMA